MDTEKDSGLESASPSQAAIPAPSYSPLPMRVQSSPSLPARRPRRAYLSKRKVLSYQLQRGLKVGIVTSPTMNSANFAVREAMRGGIRKQYRRPGRQQRMQSNGSRARDREALSRWRPSLGLRCVKGRGKRTCAVVGCGASLPAGRGGYCDLRLGGRSVGKSVGSRTLGA